MINNINTSRLYIEETHTHTHTLLHPTLHPTPRFSIMLNIAYLLPIVAFWHTITTEIKKHKQDHSVANNMVSAIHCVGYVIQYNFNYNMNYAIHVSIGYYIYDLVYLLRFIYTASATTNHSIKKSTRLSKIFAIHHIIVLYLLYDMLIVENVGHLLYIFNLAEISNLMLYVSCHLHKEYPTHKTVISIAEFIQLVLYFYVRLIRCSIIIYQEQSFFKEYSGVGNCCCVILYVMSVLWAGQLVKKNIANIANIASTTHTKTATTTND